MGFNEPKGLFRARGMVASLPVEFSEMSAASWPEESIAELTGYSAKVRIMYHLQRTSTMQEEAAIDIGALNRRVADLEFESASRKGATFVFIMPHAVTEQVKDLVSKRFGAEGTTVISVDTIMADQVGKDTLIDAHYGTISAKAMKQMPGDLTVQQKAQDEFQNAFGLSWKDALKQGWSITSSATWPSWASPVRAGAEYDKLKKCDAMFRFGDGFYYGRIEDVFVINGSTRVRSSSSTALTVVRLSGTRINSNGRTSAEGSQETDPKTACPSSLRHAVLKGLEGLGHENNGSARMPLEYDSFS